MQIQETNLKFGQLKNRQITKRIILHHTASGDVPAAEIHRWHVNQGWSGLGYHFVIRQNGSIERGRPINTIGAHSGAAGNTDSIGIVLTGNFETTRPTDTQINSLVWLIEDIQGKYGHLEIIGHRDVVATACPGRNFPWGELRKRLEEGEKVIYKTFSDLPDWAKPTIKKLMDRKSIAGDGKGNINLSEDVVKTLVILDREGVLK